MARHNLTCAARTDAVLDAAMRVVARRGFRGTTSKDIARAAGVSEALTFKMFGSKRRLYRAIVDRKLHADPICPLAEAATSSDDTAVFHAVADHMLRNMEKDPTFVRLLLYGALEGAELSARFADERMDRIVSHLADYIRGRQRAGAFVAGEPRLFALFFIGMLTTFIQAKQVFAMAPYTRWPAARVANLAVPFFLAGIREPSRPKGSKQ